MRVATVTQVCFPEPYETAIDKAIREAHEQGKFDNLPGHGRPLPGLDEPDDELWWVRDWFRREGISGAEFLPESLLLRRQCEHVDEAVAPLRTEQAVRDHVDELNRQIKRARVVSSGPPVVLTPVVADEVIARWRTRRPSRTSTELPSEQPHIKPRRAWWHRRRSA
jgi:hypothetical protein